MATWNDATVWERAPEKIYKSEPATVALVAALKKETKVYASVNDSGSNRQSWTETGVRVHFLRLGVSRDRRETGGCQDSAVSGLA